jgi:hypothetical protein
MRTKVNNVGLMHQQQTLEVNRPNSRVPVQFKPISVWSFLKLFKNLSCFFIHENSTRGPWIR